MDGDGALAEVPRPAPTSVEILSRPYAGGPFGDTSQTSWSPDGTRLGFTVQVEDLRLATPEDLRWSVYPFWSTLDGTTHDFVRTTAGDRAYCGRAPSWDGTTIRYLLVTDGLAAASCYWMFASDKEPWSSGQISDTAPLGDLDVAAVRAKWAFTMSPGEDWPIGAVVLSPPKKPRDFKILAENAWLPRWSPTERHIAFLRDDGIYTMRPDGSAQTRIFEGTVHSLDW